MRFIKFNFGAHDLTLNFTNFTPFLHSIYVIPCAYLKKKIIIIIKKKIHKKTNFCIFRRSCACTNRNPSLRVKARLHKRHFFVAISWRFVATKSPRFRTCSNLRRFTGDFFRLRVTNRHDIAASLHRRFVTTKIAAKSPLKSPL